MTVQLLTTTFYDTANTAYSESRHATSKSCRSWVVCCVPVVTSSYITMLHTTSSPTRNEKINRDSCIADILRLIRRAWSSLEILQLKSVYIFYRKRERSLSVCLIIAPFEYGPGVRRTTSDLYPHLVNNGLLGVWNPSHINAVYVVSRFRPVGNALRCYQPRLATSQPVIKSQLRASHLQIRCQMLLIRFSSSPWQASNPLHTHVRSQSPGILPWRTDSGCQATL